VTGGRKRVEGMTEEKEGAREGEFGGRVETPILVWWSHADSQL
jgi:hypothetical protein